ncbi:hypothetical protein WS95_15805 [Burkholderia sp. MSMB1826]|nr:hypothetical protein WS95_15805 [Burkholderia sp. MSMB1826]
MKTRFVDGMFSGVVVPVAVHWPPEGELHCKEMEEPAANAAPAALARTIPAKAWVIDFIWNPE